MTPAPGHDGPGSPEAEARRLAREWEQRAQSPSRDFFVASHPGWDDPAAWALQAQHDADFLLQWLSRPLDGASVLEIGCGVGRLVPALAPRVASYTGFDIAPSMVAEARARHGALPNVRFFQADGLSAPAGVRDRTYHVALAHAVFIHCPREVIAALVSDCWTLLAEGGELRFQLLADPRDGTPLDLQPDRSTRAAREDGASSAAESAADVMQRAAATDRAEREAAGQEAEGHLAVPAGLAPLMQERDYMGAAFRSDEVVPFLSALPGVGAGELAAVRVDSLHIYVSVRRPATMRGAR